MIVYHFIYDLAYFGWIDLVMTRDQPWVSWRTAIVTQFLLLVGVSLVLRTSFKPSTADFWKRWAQIAAAALLVSLGSWLVFGPRLIYFGILHFVAAALLVTRPLLRLGTWNIALGAVCVVIWARLLQRSLQCAAREHRRLYDGQAPHRRLRPSVPVDWSRTDRRGIRCPVATCAMADTESIEPA
jgi:uncharacterized membrane protein